MHIAYWYHLDFNCDSEYHYLPELQYKSKASEESSQSSGACAAIEESNTCVCLYAFMSVVFFMQILITKDNLQLLNLKNLCTVLKHHWSLDQDLILMLISCTCVYVYCIVWCTAGWYLIHTHIIRLKYVFHGWKFCNVFWTQES